MLNSHEMFSEYILWTTTSWFTDVKESWMILLPQLLKSNWENETMTLFKATTSPFKWASLGILIGPGDDISLLYCELSLSVGSLSEDCEPSGTSLLRSLHFTRHDSFPFHTSSSPKPLPRLPEISLRVHSLTAWLCRPSKAFIKNPITGFAIAKPEASFLF